MDWIYRLQERLAITKTEAIAFTALTGLFLSGLLIQHVWDSRATVPEDYYAVTDSLFEAHTSRLNGESTGGERWYDPDTSDSLEEQSSDVAPAVRMNLNTASARQLQQLAGIGPVLAERIILYREQNGPYAAVDALLNVAGIGSKTLDNIRALLYVNEGAPQDP